MTKIEALCPYGSFVRIVYRCGNPLKFGSKSQWVVPYFKKIKFKRGAQKISKKIPSLSVVESLLPLFANIDLDK